MTAWHHPRRRQRRAKGFFPPSVPETVVTEGSRNSGAFIRHQARVPGPIIGFVVNDKGPMVDFFLKESKKSKIKK